MSKSDKNTFELIILSTMTLLEVSCGILYIFHSDVVISHLLGGFGLIIVWLVWWKFPQHRRIALFFLLLVGLTNLLRFTPIFGALFAERALGDSGIVLTFQPFSMGILVIWGVARGKQVGADLLNLFQSQEEKDKHHRGMIGIARLQFRDKSESELKDLLQAKTTSEAERTAIEEILEEKF